MSEEQFNEVLIRFDHIENNILKKSDVFQAVLTVQCFVLAIVVGVVAMLDSIGGLG